MPNATQDDDKTVASKGSEALSEPVMGNASVVAAAPAVTASQETVGERLKRIYPEYYVRIITESNRVNGSERTAKILSELHNPELPAILCMFVWDRTLEGHKFWRQLAERETEGE